MNLSRSVAALVLAALGLTLLAGGADEPAAKMTVENDIVYTNAGGADLKLDMARPSEGDGPFPIVFVIHGGGWRGGNKASLRPALVQFAKRGYVAVSPQYRFCPKETFPAQVHDVKAAVRWVKAHAKQYKADPGHVGAVGFSAGGHLSLMLGVTGSSDGLEGVPESDAPDSSVQAVVNYFGPTDMAAADIPAASRPLVNDFLGGTPAEKPEVAAQASPLTFVSRGDAPILTFQGTKDPLVPHTQATKLADAMTAAGVPGRVEILIGAGHGWGGDDFMRTMNETFAFFDKYLKPAGR